MIDTQRLKKDFPIYKNNPQFVYLDSTATSLKPISVINKINEYYTQYSANIFRGVYDISEKATAEYEETRIVVQRFINALSDQEIIFTRNTTESINLFVHGIQGSLSSGDEIATTITEHHSNFVPWQQLCKDRGIKLVILKVIDPKNLKDSISAKTKVLAITYVSNVLGTINPIKEIIIEARRINPNIIVLVDGAQAVPHIKINIQDLDCDAFAFSSHKMLGPTGVGILWVKQELLKKLSSYQYGGEMIRRVTVEHTDFAEGPHRFEAGTPHISGVIALKEAIYYLEAVGLEKIHTHEKNLAQYCYDSLVEEFGEQIHIIGPSKRQTGIVAFTLEGVHAHDVAQLLNEDKIAVRAGHHCAMPLHEFLGIDATIRASFYIYNEKEDVDRLVESLKRSKHIFALK